MLDALKWKLFALALAAVGSTAAGGVAVETLFERDWFASLLNDPEKLGATGGAVIILPLIFLILSGVASYLVSVALLTAAMTAGLLYLGLEPQMTEVLGVMLPLELLTVTGVGSAVAVLLYRIVT